MSNGYYKNASPEYQKKLRKYYALAALSEGSKALLFLVFFMSQGMVKEYFLCLLFMMPLRNMGGGLHCKHYVSCFLVSFTVIYSNILFANWWDPTVSIKLLSTLLCAVIAYLLVPITSGNRPPATPEQIKHSKQNTMLILSICFVAMCIMPNNRYINIGYWTIIIHIAQLCVAFVLKEVKKNV